MGYYPIDDGAAGLIARRLSRSGAAKLHSTEILDPCAGEGRALSILANALGLDLATDAYAIELDGHRAHQCRALGIGNVLGPATFFAAKVPHQSLGSSTATRPTTSRSAAASAKRNGSRSSRSSGWCPRASSCWSCRSRPSGVTT